MWHLIFNKIDNYKWVEKEADDLTEPTKENVSLAELQRTWMNKSKYPAVFISAKNKTNVNDLKKMLYDEVRRLHVKIYPYNNFLWDNAPVENE